MTTKDFLCACLGVASEKIDEICDNFDIYIHDKEVYEILDLLEGKKFQKFGDLLLKYLFLQVADRAVEELKLDRGKFDWFTNGSDTHLYYSKVAIYRWEDLEHIASLNDE